MAIVRIVYYRTGRGLDRDAGVVKEVVESAGHQCEMQVLAPKPEWQLKLNYYWNRVKYRLPQGLATFLSRLQIAISARYRKRRVDLTIHLEEICLSFLSRSRYNWLVPNQEWFRREYCVYLQFLDVIICKTREAERIFSELHPRAIFTGFSGFYHDGTSSLPEKDFQCFLHVAGNNRKKGSVAVVEAWSRHPEWPELTVIIDDRGRLPLVPDNVRVLENIDDDYLVSLRKRAGFVLAPSEAEGFGHVLLEGMAFGSIVITTDAPPMNELIRPDHGVLVPWETRIRCNLGEQYFVSSASLEAAVSSLLATPDDELQAMAKRARDWVNVNHDAFVHRLLEQLDRTVG